MTVVVPDVAPVLHLPARLSVKPARMQVCHYCVTTFEPQRDPDSGDLWDLDEPGNPCCDDCYCPNCMTGHYPDQDCPSAPDPADDIAAREEAAYGDPDALYDARVDACLGDHE